MNMRLFRASELDIRMVTSDMFDETSRWTSEKWPRDVSDSDDASLFGVEPMVRTSY